MRNLDTIKNSSEMTSLGEMKNIGKAKISKMLAGALVCALAFATQAESAPQEWLPKGKSIDTQDYKPDAPNSPAAFSTVDPKGLNASQQKGQKVYGKWCLPCHGVNMPGTNALGVVYKDTGVPALLEARTDITPEFVSVFVRYGKHSMPFFRKTEINDEELKNLGEYLSIAHKYIKP